MRRAIDVELQESCWVAVAGPQELPIGGRVGNMVLLGAGLLVEPRARANERCHGDKRPAADKVVVAVAAVNSVHAISKQKNRTGTRDRGSGSPHAQRFTRVRAAM